MPPRTHTIEVPGSMAGVRFDHALAELVPERTRAQLQKLVRRGGVLLDGRTVRRSNVRLRGGERLLLRLEDGPTVPEPEVLLEEPTFLVVHKPAGLLVHATEREAGSTLADRMEQRFGPLPSTPDAHRPGIVHRLDRETGGLLVVARTPRALDDLRAQFRARTVEKRYLALVHGVPGEERFEVDAPLGPVDGQRDLQGVCADGRAARTRFRVLRRWRDAALLACRPHTGRRHQIRVHLFHRGHPIVGDKLYRPPSGVATGPTPLHHALYAVGLAFDRPGDAAAPGTRVAVDCEPAPAWGALVESLGTPCAAS